MKLIWMSDPHFLAEGNVAGHDPRLRVTAAVEFAKELYSDADICVISGDLVNEGSERDYKALKVILDQLPMPYLPMAGNHDDPQALRSVLPLPVGCMDGFIQYSMQTPEGLLICLDTQKVGSHAGELCGERLAWLEQTLQHAGEAPVYIFMHHPPMDLGLPMQDQIKLENGSAFLDLIGKYSNVRHLFIGHVHRPVAGTVRGVPFATMRAMLYQAPPPRPDWDWDSFEPPVEAPNIGIVELLNGDVTLQYVQFCEADYGVSAEE